MSFRFSQLLNALYSIFLNVAGSSTSSTELPSKTPYNKLQPPRHSSVPSTSSPSLNFTVLRLLHSANVSWETVLSEAGSTALSRPLSLNAPTPIFSRPSANSTLLRFPHWLKVFYSISFSAGGRTIDSSALSSKHCLPIYSSLYGNLMLFKLLQFLNTQYSILFSVDGSSTCSTELSSKTPLSAPISS